jgi:hypothetical protein
MQALSSLIVAVTLVLVAPLAAANVGRLSAEGAAEPERHAQATPTQQATPDEQATPDAQATPDEQTTPSQQATPDAQAEPMAQPSSPMAQPSSQAEANGQPLTAPTASDDPLVAAVLAKKAWAFGEPTASLSLEDLSRPLTLLAPWLVAVLDR